MIKKIYKIGPVGIPFLEAKFLASGVEITQEEYESIPDNYKSRIVITEIKVKDLSYDLNGDGKVNQKDFSKAGEVLNEAKDLEDLRSQYKEKIGDVPKKFYNNKEWLKSKINESK